VAAKLERRCVSCQRLAPRVEFWRVVRHDQTVTIDLTNCTDFEQRSILQGRSAYICKAVECLNLARKKNKLGRSLKFQISPDLYSQLLELQSSL
jgi:uncharacterized protein